MTRPLQATRWILTVWMLTLWADSGIGISAAANVRTRKSVNIEEPVEIGTTEELQENEIFLDHGVPVRGTIKTNNQGMSNLKNDMKNPFEDPSVRVRHKLKAKKDGETRQKGKQQRPKRPKRPKRAIVISDEDKYWTNGIVPYVFDSELSDDMKNDIFSAMELYERYTCIRYVPWNSTTQALYGLANEGRLHFISGSSCWSYVGNSYMYFQGEQLISCCSAKPCIHELGHALGMKHEHYHDESTGWIRKNWYDQSGNWYSTYEEITDDKIRKTQYDLSSPMHYLPSQEDDITLLFSELKTAQRYLYYLRFLSEVYQCRERHCSSFVGECYNEGFVTLVEGKCACYCPPGLDPNTRCTTTRTKVEKMTFPGGSYAFLAPVEGCPAGHGLQLAVVNHKYPSAWMESPRVQQSSVSGGLVTSHICVHQSPYNNAVHWPRGCYCLYRVGDSCPPDFNHASITLETLPGGNSANFSDVDVGSNYVTFHYCCRGDGTVYDPKELPNTQPFTLFYYSGGCQEIAGMGVKVSAYSFKDPLVSNLHNTSGNIPYYARRSNGNLQFFLCYYFPLSDNPFPPPPCVDSHENCPSLAHSGQCLTSTQVATDCPYSCDQCTGATNGAGSCIDSDTDCESMLCPTYSEAKQTACSFTCRKCSEFCGGLITLTRSDPSRVITSPNFPDPYDNNMDCYWMIVGPPDTQLSLTFSAFDVEGSDSSCHDKLQINHARIGHKGLFYCGTQLWQTIRTIYNQMELRLQTDFQNPRGGFNATVTLVLPEDHCFDQAGQGKDYRGDVSYTRDWKPCVRWNETNHCRHTPYAPYDLLNELDSNFCRNPGNGLRPWCYTSSQCDRNYCDVCFLETPYDTETDCESYRVQTNCSNTVESRQKCARTCEDLLPPRVKPTAYTQATCGPPTVPADAASGYLLKDGYTAGETVSFTCVDNADVSRLTTCLTDGRWSPLGYVCGGCPDGWVFHDNNCFMESNTLMTYNDARVHCQSLEAHVAEARTEEDMRFLVHLKDDGRSQWMALRKDPQHCFVWEDGTKPGWTKWDISASASDDCTLVLTTLHWTTGDCSTAKNTFVCQRPGLTNSTCLDYLSDCEARIQESPTLCVDKPDFAKFLCPRSCYGETCQDPCASSPCQNEGKCYVREGSFLCVCSDNYDGERCENQIEGPSPCQDLTCGCSIHKQKGECTHDVLRHYVLANCPRTCGLCDGPVSPCTDSVTTCSTSQCEQDPDNMFLQCTKSCDYCVDGPICVDQSDQCGTWISQGLCNTASVQRQCPSGCNLCFNPNCYDNNYYCRYWGLESCISNPAYMLKHCAYTCHSCHTTFPCYSRPCKNGAVCIEDEGATDGYTCNCSGTGYQGPTCEQLTNVTCAPPTPPSDAASGYTLKTIYKEGENVRFTCVDNANYSRLTTCLNDGIWSPLGYICGGCLEGWTFHENHCFIAPTTTAVIYDEAKAHCHSLQAQVAEARTEEDITFLLTLRNDDQTQWMALRKNPENPELCFIWEDGTKPGWTKWKSSNSTCADDLPECASMIQESPTVCDDNLSLAKLACPQSCYGETCQDPCASSPCQNGGRCYVRGRTFRCVCSDNYDGERCENQIVTSSSCQDENCGCSIHKARGDCTHDVLRHYTLAKCRRTCGLCDGNVSPCTDSVTTCSTSQCEQDPDNMFLQCTKSCDYCVDGPSCVDQSDQCGTWISQGQCNTTSVLRQCPHGCNLCFNPTCYNKRYYCEAWGVQECINNPSYMKYYCAHLCHSCTTMNPCYNHPCKNGGTCNVVNEFGFCNCSGTGFAGTTCEDISGCEQGWTLSEGNCYKFVGTTGRSFSDAVNECAAARTGANVTTASTSVEQGVVFGLTHRSNWVNARKNGDDNEFTWPNGSLVSEGFTNWSFDEPNGYKQMDTKCVYMYKEDGLWKDYPCSWKRKFVCKYRL